MITSIHYRSLADFNDIRLPIRLHEAPSSANMVGLVVTLLFGALMVASFFIIMLSTADFAAIKAAALKINAISFFIFLVGATLLWALLSQTNYRLGRKRIVTINDNRVTVRELTLFKSDEWREPLSRYTGVHKTKRATVGGWQQVLMLTHPQTERQVAVWVGDDVPDTLAAGYRSLLSRSAAMST